MRLHHTIMRRWTRALSTLRQTASNDASLSRTAAVVGQPTRATHPHLFVSADELTPGVSRDEYAARRRALVAAMPANSVAIFAAAPALKFHGTVIPAGRYRQDADFAYLTGVNQPDCLALVERGDTERDVRYVLVVPEHSERYMVWDGERINAAAGESIFGADASFEANERAVADVADMITRAAGGVYVDMEKVESTLLKRAFGALGRDAYASERLRPAKYLTHKLRWRKSDAEIELIQKSVDLDISAFKRALATSKVGSTEAAVMAHHEAACRIGGADRLAYPSVVGSGAAACVVHYHPNDKILRDGELLLMDAGCELNGYVSDITRTWPVNGKWTTAQLDVYSAVLDAHVACQRAARADGATSLADIHRLSVEVLAHGLSKLLPNSDARSLIRSGAYTKYYPHSIGHWLGADTHDVPTIGIATPFELNTVFTIEPGLYFPPNDPDVPKELRGIGVRIEDDFVVDRGGACALSAALPVDPDAIAALATSS